MTEARVLAYAATAASCPAEDWQERESCLKHVHDAYTSPDAPTTAHAVAALKPMFVSTLRDLRSAVVREATRALAAVAAAAGDSARGLVLDLLQCLLDVCSGSVKVIAAYADECVRSLIKHVRFRRGIELLVANAGNSHRALAMRRHCIEYLALVMEVWPFEYIDRDSTAIGDALSRGAADSAQECRAAAKHAFRGYAAMWPRHAADLVAQAAPRTARLLAEPADSEQPRQPRRQEEHVLFRPGDKVRVALAPRQSEFGTVRYVGEVAGAAAGTSWVGVELTTAAGRGDGAIKGQRYFSCRPLHAVFLRPSHVELVSGASTSSPAPPGRQQQDRRSPTPPTPAPQPQERRHSPALAPPPPPPTQPHGGQEATLAVLRAHKRHVGEVLEMLREEMELIAELDDRGAALGASSTDDAEAYKEALVALIDRRAQSGLRVLEELEGRGF